MFLSIGAMGKLSRKFFICISQGSVGGFNDGGKNGRCSCPDVEGIQLALEEQARLLELLLGVAHTAKTPRGAGFVDRR